MGPMVGDMRDMLRAMVPGDVALGRSILSSVGQGRERRGLGDDESLQGLNH